MSKKFAHSKQRHQFTEDTHSSVSKSTTKNHVKTYLPSSSRSPSCFHQPDQPHVASPTTVPLKNSQAATTCAGSGGSTTNTTERRFLKNNHTTPSSSPSRKATASLLQPNQKPAAMLSDATQGRDPSNLSGSSEKVARDGAVSSNESTVLDNYPNNRKKQIQPIIHHLVKKERSKSADPSFRSSKMPISEFRMAAALGSIKKIRPLNKNERKEDWKTLIESVATGYAESDPVDTTNTDSPTSASSNVGNADDLNAASDLSQNQSKCGFFLIF